MTEIEQLLVSVITSHWLQSGWTAKEVARLTVRTLEEHGYKIVKEEKTC